MPTGRARNLGRLVRAATAAIALTLLAGGLAMHPAGATTRQGAVNAANDFIAYCYGKGGNPHVWSAGDELIEVSCWYPDGSSLDCQFYPDFSCTRFGPGTVLNPGDDNAPPLVRPPAGYGAPGGNGAASGGSGGMMALDPGAAAPTPDPAVQAK